MKKVKIISRTKLNGLGKHYGVMLDDGRCFDLQPLGIRQLTLEEFAGGYDVKIEQEVPLTGEIYERIKSSAKANIRYSFFRFNCESFARYLATGKAESKQLRYLAASTGAAGLCYYLLRTPLNTFLF